MSKFNIIVSSDEYTVVAEYNSENNGHSEKYQSEAELEQEFIDLLVSQGYEYLPIHKESELRENIRKQLEQLNNYTFTDSEWNRFFDEYIANTNEGIVEKTRKIQYDYIKDLKRDDGTTKNIHILDKENIHNNRLQVINQYIESGGNYQNRYDVTILVNGLPLVHIELKRRGVDIREAFNQINRYQNDSFWASSGLFEYVQIFVISNGTKTKYYSNTVRNSHINEQQNSNYKGNKKTSNSFAFTSFWADGNNKIIPDLVDFTKTFFTKHTLLNVLTKYCVFTSENLLLVMRPYQIVATERIISRIQISTNYNKVGTIDAGGYIWHTTGSGKTLTSFKTAQMVSYLPYIDKVLFVVDRKDLDYQTMKEYDRFEKGAANGNNSTRILQRQLEDRDEKGNHHPYKIIITTIQKLDMFIHKNKQHEIYKKHVVIIFDECHRSQFGNMHRAITRAFNKYHIFGFTGTPIFAENAGSGNNQILETTEQAFGDKLHTYTIVDAINDGNVLPFRVDFIDTFKKPDNVNDRKIGNIDSEKVLEDPKRIREIVTYVLDHFNQKTKRDSYYILNATYDGIDKQNYGSVNERGEKRYGFNSIFATASITMAKNYYKEFKHQIKERKSNLNIAIIFSYNPNEGEPEGLLPDEDFNMDKLDKNSRYFLDDAINDYNTTFHTNYDTSADKFQNYYKDVSLRMKNREIDILIVVNMFLTGFDATTLNTLWVDKNLRQHGLIQAFSRTNRILNSVKTYGNIVCFRDLKNEMDKAMALFGNKDASGIVLLKTYNEYYNGYEENGIHRSGYKELINDLKNHYPLEQPIIGEEAKKRFIQLYGSILKIRNILSSFDEFQGNEILSERCFQDYQSNYIDLYENFKRNHNSDKETINDDVVFEIGLIRQIEVNIDYILMLVDKYQKSKCKDRDILTTIDRAVNSSIDLRSKKELIRDFVEQVNPSTKVYRDWPIFLNEHKESDIKALIKEENLRPDETYTLINNAFRDGIMKTTGSSIDKIMPPLSLFDPNREFIKRRIIEKLLRFFKKYLGLV